MGPVIAPTEGMGPSWCVLIAALLCAFTTACNRLDDQLQHHREKFESLAASAGFIGNANSDVRDGVSRGLLLSTLEIRRERCGHFDSFSHLRTGVDRNWFISTVPDRGGGFVG